MSKIVDRYIADRASHERNLEGDISIADLRNLKNDVVGLRYVQIFTLKLGNDWELFTLLYLDIFHIAYVKANFTSM